MHEGQCTSCAHELWFHVGRGDGGVGGGVSKQQEDGGAVLGVTPLNQCSEHQSA